MGRVMPCVLASHAQEDLLLQGLHILPTFWGALACNAVPRLQTLTVEMPDAAAAGLHEALVDLCRTRAAPFEVTAEKHCGQQVKAAFEAAQSIVAAAIPYAQVKLTLE